MILKDSLRSATPPGEAKRCKPLACTLYYSPMGKLLPFNEPLCCGGLRVDIPVDPCKSICKNIPPGFRQGVLLFAMNYSP